MKEYIKFKEIEAHSFDVIVVGCGPVGAIIANLLGMEGLNVCIIEKEKNIYEELMSSSIHCTVNSSCAIDALTIGVPTIFINVSGFSEIYFEPMPGSFYFINNAIQLISFIESYMPSKRFEIMAKSYSLVSDNHEQKIFSFIEKHLSNVK